MKRAKREAFEEVRAFVRSLGRIDSTAEEEEFENFINSRIAELEDKE